MNQLTEKWMGLDFGMRRIGVAVSDSMGMLARRFETINWNGKDWEWALDRLAAIIRQESISGLVIGLPRRTDGLAGDSENIARLFSCQLAKKTGIQPVLLDERYTTVLANRILTETGIKKERKKAVIDQIAAEIILQDYLDSNRS